MTLNFSTVADLSSKYNFHIWSDQSVLSRCDEVSSRFHGHKVGQYRKFAAWEGPYDRFAYIDIDTIILRSLDAAFELLEQCDVLTAVSNIATIRQFVWTGDVNQVMPLLDSDYAANTGFIVSKKGGIPLAKVEKMAEEAQVIKHLMALECTEQPFLNYAIVTSGLRYTSLSQLRKREPSACIPKEIWAGMFNEDIISLDGLPQLIHWAGRWQSGDHLKSRSWKHFRYLRDGLLLADEIGGSAP